MKSATLPRVAEGHSDIGTPPLPIVSTDRRHGAVRFHSTSGRNPMKNSAILVGVLALASVLSACGDMPTKVDRNPPVPPCPSDTCIVISVAIVGGNIQAPEISYMYRNHTDIVWTIIDPGPYTFPDTGIVFLHPGNFICHPHQGGSKMFTCRKNGNPLGKSKYTINVNAGSYPLPALPLNPLDPVIFNM